MWLIDDYQIDSLAIPIQLSKPEIVELINAMVPKISWYVHSGGGWKPTDPKGEIPAEFNVEQNFPNPFNPVTEIRYTLPRESYVNISIYNILGQKVKNLVDEYQSAGYKTVKWNGKNDQGQNVASGVYFYKIKAGDFTKVKKMVIIK